MITIKERTKMLKNYAKTHFKGIIFVVGIFAILGAVILLLIENHNKNETIRKLIEDNKSLNEMNAKYKNYIDLSVYYSNVSRLVWGKYAGACDVGLILKIEQIIKETGSDTVGIDVPLVLSVIVVESGFNRYIKSYAGAVGIMQIMPSTAKGYVKAIKEEDLYDENLNLKIGIMELKRLMIVFNGDKELALLSYNRGERRVKELIASGESPRNKYSTKVLNIYFYN